MAAERSAGSAGENLGLPRFITPNGAHRHAIRRQRDLGHLHAQAHINAGRHRVDQAPVSPVRHIAEVITVVLDLVPHPAQRLAPGEIGGLGFDDRVQRLARPPGRSRCQSGARHEGFDPLRRRRVRPEFGPQ